MTDATWRGTVPPDVEIRARVQALRGQECVGTVRRVGTAMALLLAVVAVYDALTAPGDQRVWRTLSDVIPAAVLALIVIAGRRGLVTDRNAGWWVVLGSTFVSVAVWLTAYGSGLHVFLTYLAIMVVVNGASALDRVQLTTAQVVPVVGSALLVLGIPTTLTDTSIIDWMQVVVVAVVASIALHLGRTRVFSDMAQLVMRLEVLAYEDPLTGLATPRGLLEVLPALITRATESALDVFVLLIDVDGLGALNEGEGRRAGDDAVKSVAGCMRAAARSADLLIRWGSDDFAVIGMGDAEAPWRWDTSLRQLLQDLPGTAGGSRPGEGLQVSTGVSMTTASRVDLAELVEEATAAMNRDRAARRGGSELG